MIKKLVDELKAKGWVFAYIGANQDVETVAATISITNVMNFEATHHGTQAMFTRQSNSQSRFYDRICRERIQRVIASRFFQRRRVTYNNTKL